MAITKETKVLKLSELHDHPKNPNKHPKEQIEDIAKSMEEYGQYFPLIVDETNTILIGHGKKQALELLGRDEGEVTIMHGLTEKQKLKILLSDNKIQGMSFLDHRMEEDVIRAVGEVGIIGYNDDFVADLIGAVEFDTIGMEVQKPVDDYAEQAQSMNTPPPPTPSPMPNGSPSQPSPVPTDELGQKTQVDDDDDPMASFTAKHYMTCPHCGGRIEI